MKVLKRIGTGLIVVLILTTISASTFFLGVWGTGVGNLKAGVIQKVDNRTNYNTRKNVEDTCRAMVASYKADKLRYEQYISSDDKAKQEWGEQAKMRANSTAANYNEYVLKNSYIWDGNIPEDINFELSYLN